MRVAEYKLSSEEPQRIIIVDMRVEITGTSIALGLTRTWLLAGTGAGLCVQGSPRQRQVSLRQSDRAK